MALIELRHIARTFGERSVLRDVSLSIDAGSVLALCGRSGSGKTTLVRIISGLTGFDTGTLSIDGHVITAESKYPATLFGRIGVVFQEHNLFPHLSAVQNVELALREVRRMAPREARGRALCELERVGVVDRANQHPATLSGGERQRVALARALAMDPMALLLDEPTANLEPARVKEVQRCIQQLAGSGVTMLLVTHNLEFAERTADHFARLDNGTVTVSEGTEVLDPLRNEQY